MNEYRTHKCNELGLDNIDNSVKLSGWSTEKETMGGFFLLIYEIDMVKLKLYLMRKIV